MRNVYDLSQCSWQLVGFAPYEWTFQTSMETGAASVVEFAPVPAAVPGSVQGALRAAGVLPDWNVGLNSLQCEWVENRHWLYQASLPDAWPLTGKCVRLRCMGLDYSGLVLVNGQEAGRFAGTHVEHVFDLAAFLKPEGNFIQILFLCPPRWLGQFGYTSQMTEWKTRFNYTWDWCPRLVQIGIWDSVLLEVCDGPSLEDLRCLADFDVAKGTGYLKIWGQAAAADACQVQVELLQGGRAVRQGRYSASEFHKGIVWDGLAVSPWWPNGSGDQPLYEVRCRLLRDIAEADCRTRTVGFKNVQWRACDNAPAGADPWICVVNGRSVFLQGVDWTPIRPNFADLQQEDYRSRLETYRDLGVNVARVWGGGILEKTWFYDLCDRLGILVWQEFPLSSAGKENWPPEDAGSIDELSAIARLYIRRRQHHVSLLMWCGGNELQGTLDGGKAGCGKPVTMDHPLMRAWDRIVRDEDPGRRFLETSASGPRFIASEKDFGKGLHWDVHGPWQAKGKLEEDWARYWQTEDALFRSETGCPGASPVDLIRQYKGSQAEMPCTMENPIWRRTKWWIECPQFVAELGRQPRDLEEYVAWSQDRQAKALAYAAATYKAKFPRCGGLILWMGHDAWPVMTNTSILDYLGRPKPAAIALAAVFGAQGAWERK